MESFKTSNPAWEGQPVHKFYNGAEMPLIGLGTYDTMDKEAIKRALLELKYRVIDTAALYENETQIGEGLSEIFKSGALKREDLFIVTKLCIADVEDVEGAVRTSLKKLQLDYVDLYFVHWPVFTKSVKNEKGEEQIVRINKSMQDVWRDMEALVEKGLVKNIGISNYNVQSTWDLLSYCKIKPVANQIEVNPLYQNAELIRYLNANGILPISYSPVARGAAERGVGLFDRPLIKELAEKYKKTPGQIILRWNLQQGNGVIPMSTNFER